MRLLLTNDDSIESPFLHELIHALRAAGHDLIIAAPKTEQSWIGCAKSRHREVLSSFADRGFGCPTWIIDGTPGDCVNIALAHIIPAEAPVDAVVSGINIGRNASLGFILASGTIAGAWEGAIHGLPAIAFSLDLSAEQFKALHASGLRPDADLLPVLKIAATRAAQLVPPLVAATPPRSFIVHNVNFPNPCTTHTAVHRTVPARVVAPGLFGPAADNGTHRFIFKHGDDLSPAAPLTDRAAIEHGLISHTVLDYTKLGVA